MGQGYRSVIGGKGMKKVQNLGIPARNALVFRISMPFVAD